MLPTSAIIKTFFFKSKFLRGKSWSGLGNAEKQSIEKRLKKIKPAKLKAIAKKLHPDALKMDDPRRAEYEEDFKRASAANNEGRWGELFDIVDRHGVPLKEYKEAIECLKFDIKRIKAELEKEKSTYWY